MNKIEKLKEQTKHNDLVFREIDKTKEIFESIDDSNTIEISLKTVERTDEEVNYFGRISDRTIQNLDLELKKDEGLYKAIDSAIRKYTEDKITELEKKLKF